MNKEIDKLDDLFRKGLEDPVGPGYRETDWDSLQQMLDGQKKQRGIVYWMPILSGVAALLLLVFGWWLFMPKGSHPSGTQQAVIRHKAAPANKIEKPGEQPDHKQVAPGFTDYAKNHLPENNHTSGNKGGNIPIAVIATNVHPENPSDRRNDGNNPQFTETLTAVFDKPVIGQSINTYQVNATDIPRPLLARVDFDGAKSKVNIKQAYHPQFALTVLAAPDLNGVGSFQQSKLGTNIGLGFSTGVSRKITVSTGVVYSNKPYLTGFGNYHTPYQFQTNPVNVTADCRMLDIPLNVSYQLYNKHQNSLSFGTGLSSYIMLHQKYTFNYAGNWDPYTSNPKSYTVPNSSSYFFGVVNLNATYVHELNSKVGLSIQPYLKLPLADIGYSQVRLQSTGVAIGLTWNLNSISKN